MRTRILLALAGALVLGGGGPAAAALPSDISADPLDRAALLALPSVYRVQVTIRVEALRLSRGRRRELPPRARTITEAGTAVAVADGGWLVSAAHLAAPDGPTIARMAYQNDLAVRGSPRHVDEQAALAWVAANRARPVGPGVVRVEVTPADPGGATAAAVPVREVVPTRDADLALIRIDAPGAPALDLDEAAGLGTAVVAIGFGTGSALGDAPRRPGEPALRRGALIRTAVTGKAPVRQVQLTSIPVERGDSGAPVVDAAGRVRAIVTRRLPEGGIAEKATEVRLLLRRRGAVPGANRSAELFGAAMAALWRLDLAEAARGFDATLVAFPGHTLAARERARAVALAAGDYRLAPRRRGTLLGTIGILAAVAALACGVALARGASGRGSAGGRGR